MAKISTAGYEVVETGTVILFDYMSDVELDFEGKADLLIRISFSENDDTAPKLEVDFNNNIFHFKCTRFNSALGIGLAEPFEVGIDKNGRIFAFRFWISMLGEKKTRRMEYTLYREVSIRDK